MKKLLVLLFALFAVLLVGCGGARRINPHALLLTHPAVTDTLQFDWELLPRHDVARTRTETARPLLTLAHRHPRSVAKPQIEVDPFISQVLHSSTGTWTGNPTSFAYQWQRCDSGGANCSSITGATNNTYTVVTADAGSTIRVMVTATNNAGSASQTSAATTVVLATPFNTSLPVISGTTTQGQVLSTSNGAWDNSPTSFTYQWLRCDTTGAACSNIAAATASTYTLVSGDVGSTIRARVTAINASGSAFAASQPSAVIVVPASTGTTYYVDNQTGNNGFAGTSPSTAWASISKVNSTTLTADQTVLFKGGQTFTGQLVPNGSGTSGHPTTYGSYGTGHAIIAGAQSLRPAGVSWVTIQNLTFDGQNAGSDCVVTFGAGAVTHFTMDSDEVRNCVVGIDQAQASDANWTIQNSFIHDTTSSGIIVGGPSHTANGGGFVIQGNQIENVGTPVADVCNCNNAHGIYDDSPGLIVRNNDIGNFQTDGVSVRFRNATIEHNTIHDGTRTVCCAEGIGYYNYDPTETAGQGTSIVRYNRIWNVPYGIHMSNEADGAGSVAGPENWRVYNNVISGSGGGSGTSQNAIEYILGVGTELIEKNNVIAGSFSSGAQANVGTPATYQEDYNDWSSVGGPGNGNAGAHDKTTAANLSAAPNFAPPAGSPVIDAGTATVAGASFTNFCNGAVLDYCGSAPDMGAVEFLTGVSSGPANTSPPLISGSAIQGQSMNATPGTWSGSPTSFAYQWQACDAGAACTNITGQTGSSYNPLLVTEVNHTVRVAVTATNAAGSNTAFSAVSAVVAPSGSVGGTPTTPVVGNASTVCNKYASPSGVGGNTGAIGSPWDLATLASSLTAGQVGCLRAGSYGTTSSTWSFTNATGITITGYPGEAATINGFPSLAGAGATWSYINWDLNHAATRAGGSSCVLAGGQTAGSNGLLIDASNLTFAHNNLNQLDLPEAQRTTGIGVGFNAAISNVTIQNNFIHDIGGCSDLDHGIYWDQVTGGQITGNWIYNDPHGAAIQMYPAGSGLTVSGNVLDNTSIGLFYSNSPGGDSVTHNVISNQVGFRNGCLDGTGGCGNTGFSTGGLAYSGGGAGAGDTFTNNDVFNAPAGICNPCIAGDNGTSITSDPQYTNLASDDYRTQAGAVSGYGLWNGDAGSVVSDPTLFGKASVGGSGAGNGGMGANLNRAIKYTSAKTGTIRRMSIYLVGGLTAGTQTLQANVYADSSGVPGSLLATSAPISFSSTGAAGWYDLTLTSPLAVTSGTNYWLSILSGDTGGVAGFRWDSVAGSRLFQNNAFGSGPVNPFGTPSTTDDEQMSFYAIVQ